MRGVRVCGFVEMCTKAIHHPLLAERREGRILLKGELIVQGVPDGVHDQQAECGRTLLAGTADRRHYGNVSGASDTGTVRLNASRQRSRGFRLRLPRWMLEQVSRLALLDLLQHSRMLRVAAARWCPATSRRASARRRTRVQ